MPGYQQTRVSLMLDPEYLSASQKCGDILLQLGMGLGNRPGTEGCPGDQVALVNMPPRACRTHGKFA